MDQQAIDEDPEVYDCDACPLRTALADLATDEANLAAWRLYRTLMNRFLVDAQAVGHTLARLTEDLDADTYADTCERLRVLYDTLAPPKDPT